MTTDLDKKAEAYVRKHVIYANDFGRFQHHLELFANNPEFYPEAETCDGCDKDTIAVYQAFKAGYTQGQEDANSELQQRDREMMRKGFEGGAKGTYVESLMTGGNYWKREYKDFEDFIGRIEK